MQLGFETLTLDVETSNILETNYSTHFFFVCCTACTVNTLEFLEIFCNLTSESGLLRTEDISEVCVISDKANVH